MCGKSDNPSFSAAREAYFWMRIRLLELISYSLAFPMYWTSSIPYIHTEGKLPGLLPAKTLEAPQI